MSEFFAVFVLLICCCGSFDFSSLAVVFFSLLAYFISLHFISFSSVPNNVHLLCNFQYGSPFQQAFSLLFCAPLTLAVLEIFSFFLMAYAVVKGRVNSLFKLVKSQLLKVSIITAAVFELASVVRNVCIILLFGMLQSIA